MHCVGRRKSSSITTISAHDLRLIATGDTVRMRPPPPPPPPPARQHGHLAYALDHADRAVTRSGWATGCSDEIGRSYSAPMSPNQLSLWARKLQYRQAQKALRSWRSQFLPYLKTLKPQVKDRKSHLSLRAHQHSPKCHGGLGEHAEHQTGSQIMYPHRIRYNWTHTHIHYKVCIKPSFSLSLFLWCTMHNQIIKFKKEEKKENKSILVSSVCFFIGREM